MRIQCSILAGKCGPGWRAGPYNVWEDHEIHRGESAATWQAQCHLRYASEKILKLAASISRDKLVLLGTCLGKFTKTHKFQLHITALDYLVPYAKYKVRMKPRASSWSRSVFPYGNHLLKYGLGWITKKTSQYQRVVVCSMADIPWVLGWQENLHKTAEKWTSWWLWYFIMQTLENMWDMKWHWFKTKSRPHSCVEGPSFVPWVCVDSTTSLNFVNTVTSSGTPPFTILSTTDKCRLDSYCTEMALKWSFRSLCFH